MDITSLEIAKVREMTYAQIFIIEIIIRQEQTEKQNDFYAHAVLQNILTAVL